MLASPYYAVIFTSIRSDEDPEGYHQMAQAMEDLARRQDGFIDFESARNELGITVSYWSSLEAIKQWKLQRDHLLAQQFGKEKWYLYYKVRICKVEREYDFGHSA